MLKDVEDALRVLRDRTRLNGLHFNAVGAAEMIVGEGVSIFFNRISDNALEISSRLENLRDPDDGLMDRMLQVNADCSDGARFAIEPGRDAPILCRRVDVELFDEEDFAKDISHFISRAMYWRGEGGDLLARGR